MRPDLLAHPPTLLPPGARPAPPDRREPPHVDRGHALAVELHVDDPDAAARWFCRWGFSIIRQTRSFVTLDRGGSLLFLGRRPATRPPPTAGTVGELRVLVPDAVATRREVRPADVVVLDLHEASYGLIEFVVASDFGIDLRIATPACYYASIKSHLEVEGLRW